MSDSSDSTGEFINGPNQSLFGNPDASDTDPDDWQLWDWHQIEAAIMGGEALTTQDEEDRALGIADPTSLQAAADVFYTVQQTLQAAGDDLVREATILAGLHDDSPWKGDAAEAFLDMIKTFANDIYANVNALKDASGTSVADLLIDNANMLAWAQHEISYIDSYYANLAAQQGASSGPGGEVQIHEFPNLVYHMNDDMHTTMNLLTSSYKASGPSRYPSAVQPQPVSPNGNTNVNLNNFNNITGDPNLNNDGPNFNFNPNLNFNPPTYPNIQIPNPKPPDYPNIKIPNLDIPNGLDLNSNLGNPNGLDLGSNLGNPNGLDLNSNLGNPNGLDLGSNLGNPNGLDLYPNLVGNPNGLDSGSNLGDGSDTGGLSPYLGNYPNLNSEPSTSESDPALDDSGLSNYSALNPAMDEALNPGLTSPNLTSGDPTGLDDETGLPNTEDQSALGGTDPALSGASDESAAGDGMPYMPGMGGGAGSSLASEPSDASGLLGGEEPFSSDSPLTSDDLGSLSGAAPGAGVGDEAAAGDGMPYMPGMGGGAGQTSTSDPSDASGLLGDESEPWAEPESTVGDEIGSANGAEAATAAEEMPFMPGTGGLGQAGAQGAEERSDASGLLAEADRSWTEGDEEYAEEIGSSNGAAEAVQAAWIGAGAAVAAAGLAEGDDAGHEELPAPGGAEQEFSAFVDPGGTEEQGVELEQEAVEREVVEQESVEAEYHHDDGGADRVPVIRADGSDDDLSGWDLAGAAADAALFTLGAWANRRRGRGEDDETLARAVSREQEVAWLGGDAESSEVDEEDQDLLGAATWRPVRGLGGSGESAPIPLRALRSARPPKDYDPEAAAAAAAETAEAERVAVQAAEDTEKRQRSSADLLTQDRDMWGTPRPDWDAL